MRIGIRLAAATLLASSLCAFSFSSCDFGTGNTQEAEKQVDDVLAGNDTQDKETDASEKKSEASRSEDDKLGNLKDYATYDIPVEEVP